VYNYHNFDKRARLLLFPKWVSGLILNMKTPLTSSVAALIAFTLTAFGADIPLQQATVNRIINDVKIVAPKSAPRCANINDVIKDEIGVKTGLKSRCELLFQDNTITRLGAETFFSFKPGTREMSLTEGTMLLQVPKNQGGATIRTASVTASITGTTVMVEHRPDKSIKFLVLEGSMRVGNGRLGERVSLTPGKMIIMNPKDKRLPDPVNVDLKKLIKTSSLVNPSGFAGGGDGKKMKSAMLPSMGLINQSIKEQDVMRSKGMLQDTNLAILGKGTSVVMADESMLAKMDSAPMGEMMSKMEGSPMADMMAKMDTQSMAMEMSSGAKGLGTTPNPPEATPAVIAGNVLSGEPQVSPVLIVDNSVRFIDNVGGGDIDLKEAGSGAGGDSGSGSGGEDSGVGSGEPDPTPRGTLLANPVLLKSPVDSLPNWSAIASAVATQTLNTPPTAFGAVAVNGDSVFTGGEFPTIVAGTSNWIGGTYAGPANDGSAALFLLGNVTDFEAQVGFDAIVGYGNGTTFANGGISVFKASDISIGGHLCPGAADLKDIALVAQNNIGTHADGLTLDLSGMRSLTLATTEGKVVLGTNSDISAAGDDFKFLHIHSRGGTLLTVDDSLEANGAISLPNAALIVSGNEDVSFRIASNVNVKEAYVNAGDQVELFGTFAAGKAALNARNTAEFAGDVSIENLSLHAKNFVLRRGSLSVGDAELNLSRNFDAGGNSSMIGSSEAQNADTNPVFTFKNLTINANGVVSLNTSDMNKARLDFSQAESFAVNNASHVVITGGLFAVPEAVNAVLDVVSVDSKGSLTTVTGFDFIKTSANLETHNLTAGDLRIGGDIISSGAVKATNANVVGTVYGDSLEFANATVGGGFYGATVKLANANIGGNFNASNSLEAGMLTVGGNLNGKDVTIADGTVGGNVNFSGNLDVQNLNVGGFFLATNFSGEKATINSSATVLHDLSVGQLNVRGSLAVGGAIRPGSLNSPSATTVLMAGSFQAADGLQFKGANGSSGSAGGLLEVYVPEVTNVLTPGFSFSSSTVAGANFDGGDATNVHGSGGSGGSLEIGTAGRAFAGMVTLDAKVSATTGKNGDDVDFGGTGGTVSVAATGKITVKNEIAVSKSEGPAKSRAGGNILLQSAKTAGTAIEITSSAQLNALLAASAPGQGGKIEFKSAGGLIVANGGKFQADRGTVSFENSGNNGNITLNNTQMSADTIKVAALGNNGTLNIGGGTLKANALLNLFAAGSNGTIRFTDSTKLDGNGLKFISANTVTINNGKTVTVGGVLPAAVFANQANFTGSGGNGSTTGKFDGRGAVRMPFGNAPSY
jgi:hypothetical protein